MSRSHRCPHRCGRPELGTRLALGLTGRGSVGAPCGRLWEGGCDAGLGVLSSNYALSCFPTRAWMGERQRERGWWSRRFFLSLKLCWDGPPWSRLQGSLVHSHWRALGWGAPPLTAGRNGARMPPARSQLLGDTRGLYPLQGGVSWKPCPSFCPRPGSPGVSSPFCSSQPPAASHQSPGPLLKASLASKYLHTSWTLKTTASHLPTLVERAQAFLFLSGSRAHCLLPPLL